MNGPSPETTGFLYGDIVKVDDEQHVVEGFVSADGVDIGGHVIDQAWLKKAIPQWVARWGNIREMHDPHSAVGVAKAADVVTQPKPWISAHVVDPLAWEKVKAGVYKGFSVGIKNPVIVSDASAPRGRVVGGDLLEISLVDRPANPEAFVTLFKVASTGEVRDEQHGVVLSPDVDPDVEEGFRQPTSEADLAFMSPEQRAVWEAVRAEYGAAPGADLTKAAPVETKSQPEAVDGATRLRVQNLLPYLYGQPGHAKTRAAFELASLATRVQLPEDVQATVAATLGPLAAEFRKRDFTTAERGSDAKSGNALPDGSFPIENVKDLHNAVVRLHQAKDRAAAAAHIRKRAKELGVKVPDTVEKTIEAVVGATSPDLTKAAVVKHPHAGEHNHPHAHTYFPPGLTHQHNHSHNEDDVHEHGHYDVGGVEMSAEATVVAAAAAELTAANPDVAKSDPSFGYGTPAALPAVAQLRDQVNTMLKTLDGMLESLAGQTDRDRDGDVDTPANMGANGTGDTRGPATDFKAQRPVPTVVSPQILPLTLTTGSDLGDTAPDLAKSIDALVTARVNEALSKLTPVRPEVGALSADVAKSVAAIAREVGRLATGVGAVAEQQAEVGAQVAEIVKRQERVERMATPPKGQTVVVAEKTIGLQQPDVAKSAPVLTMEQMVEKARSLNPEDREAATQAMIAALYKMPPQHR